MISEEEIRKAIIMLNPLLTDLAFVWVTESEQEALQVLVNLAQDVLDHKLIEPMSEGEIRGIISEFTGLDSVRDKLVQKLSGRIGKGMTKERIKKILHIYLSDDTWGFATIDDLANALLKEFGG